MMAIAALVLALTACGKSDKPKLINYLKKNVELMKSEEYKKDPIKAGEKALALLGESGFKDLDELVTASEKHRDDSDVRALNEELMKLQEGLIQRPPAGPSPETPAPPTAAPAETGGVPRTGGV